MLKEALGLRWTDIDRGQMQRMGQEHPVALPAALIELGAIQWHDATGRQYGELQMTVSLYVERGQETYGGAEGEAAALALVEMQDAVYAALVGKSGSCWTSMTRLRTEPPQWPERMAKLSSVWKCTVVQEKPEEVVELRAIEMAR